MTLMLSTQPFARSVTHVQKVAGLSALPISIRSTPPIRRLLGRSYYSRFISPGKSTERTQAACSKAFVSNSYRATPSQSRSITTSTTSKGNLPSRATFATARAAMEEAKVHGLFEPVTGSWQYVVADPATSKAVIIDPVLDYDAAKGVLSTGSADAIINLVKDNGYTVEMILETHIHADHITAAAYIQAQLSKFQDEKPLIGIGSRIKGTQKLFGDRYNISETEYSNVFDRLWEDDEEFHVGSLTARAIHLPGHTPDHMGYQFGNNVFVGDSIFHVDIGSARADFPGGSAEAVWNSGRKLLSLPEDFKIWVGHDYPPEGREPVPYVTIKQHRAENKHLKDGTQEAEFVKMRKERDQSLAAPRLLHPSLQMNLRGGRLPAPTASGLRVIHLPLKVPEPTW